MVYIERIIVRLSTCCARFGISSDTHMPDLPYCWNLNGLRIRPPADLGFDTSLAIFSKYGSPLCFSGIGLGSKRSTWLGPPFMKSWMTDFAFAGKWGARGLRS